MNENERIVCEFLRKIAPPYEWRYLGEDEHYWIGQLCDELNKQIKTENAKLRELVKDLMGHVTHPPCEGCMAEMNCDCSDLTQCDEWSFFEADARRLGIEVD